MTRVHLIVIGVVLAIGVVVANSALFTVHQSHQALILQFGNPVRVEREPGLKVKMPFIQDVTYFEKRILNLDPPVQEVILSDQKRINVDSFARFRIVDPLEFRKRAGTLVNFGQIIGNRLNSAIRSEVAKADLADMLSGKRGEIMGKIAVILKTQGAEFGVEIIDVRIGRTDLPEATSQAVYNRMRSARVAQAAELRAQGDEIKAKVQAEADRQRTVLLAEAQKTAQTLRGEGEGTKTEILNKAFGMDQEFFTFYRSMEAYGQALGDGTTMVLSPDSDFFRYFGQSSGTLGKMQK